MPKWKRTKRAALSESSAVNPTTSAAAAVESPSAIIDVDVTGGWNMHRRWKILSTVAISSKRLLEREGPSRSRSNGERYRGSKSGRYSECQIPG